MKCDAKDLLVKFECVWQVAAHGLGSRWVLQDEAGRSSVSHPKSMCIGQGFGTPVTA